MKEDKKERGKIKRSTQERNKIKTEQSKQCTVSSQAHQPLSSLQFQDNQAVLLVTLTPCHSLPIQRSLTFRKSRTKLQICSSHRHICAGHYGGRSRVVRAWSASPRTSPTFGRRLVGSAARVGGRLTLACDLRGSPTPASTWYR